MDAPTYPPPSDERTQTMKRMKRPVAPLAVVAFGLLLPAVMLAQKTSFDLRQDPWTSPRSRRTRRRTARKSAIHSSTSGIVDSIDAELTAKGLTKNDANPDVTVIYHVAFDKKQDITTYSTGMALRSLRLRLGRRAGAAPKCACARSSRAR